MRFDVRDDRREKEEALTEIFAQVKKERTRDILKKLHEALKFSMVDGSKIKIGSCLFTGHT